MAPAGDSCTRPDRPTRVHWGVLFLARRLHVLLGLLCFAGCELVGGIDTPTLQRGDGGPLADAGPFDAATTRTLHVALRGNLVGHVTSEPDGIDCPGKCTA